MKQPYNHTLDLVRRLNPKQNTVTTTAEAMAQWFKDGSVSSKLAALRHAQELGLNLGTDTAIENIHLVLGGGALGDAFHTAVMTLAVDLDDQTNRLLAIPGIFN